MRLLLLTHVYGCTQDELSGDLEKAVRKWMAESSSGFMSSEGIRSVESMDESVAVLDSAYALVAGIDAQNIKEACAGFGTDDDALTDILCNRNKKQHHLINEAYKAKFEVSLLEQIKDECGGHYKTFLTSMLTDQVMCDADWVEKASACTRTAPRRGLTPLAPAPALGAACCPLIFDTMSCSWKP